MGHSGGWGMRELSGVVEIFYFFIVVSGYTTMFLLILIKMYTYIDYT